MIKCEDLNTAAGPTVCASSRASFFSRISVCCFSWLMFSSTSVSMLFRLASPCRIFCAASECEYRLRPSPVGVPSLRSRSVPPFSCTSIVIWAALLSPFASRFGSLDTERLFFFITIRPLSGWGDGIVRLGRSSSSASCCCLPP
uniref:Uncharacterized protein n=1 Tax=Anopheles arabiensis TaxID=7173 RepID=A0A182I4H6_ANOAR